MMFFNKFFKTTEKYNPDYEESLQNDGIREFNGNATLLIIADTHGDIKLNPALRDKLENIKEHDACFLLGDISDYDYRIIKEIVPEEKIYGLLGNHEVT